MIVMKDDKRCEQCITEADIRTCRGVMRDPVYSGY